MDKQLIILKSVSGNGKSTLAKFLVNNLSCKSDYFEADSYMVDENGKYCFKPENLGFAHNKCKNGVESAMLAEMPVIILSNTSTKIRDVQPYLDLAAKYDYKVVSLVLEKYHSNKDVHGLNEETLARQEANLKQSLKLR